VTATQLIYRAARLLGYIRQGMTLPADVLNDGLDALNDLLSSWRTESLMVFSISDDLYTLSVNVQSYTIGPTGAFVATRPEYIKQANLVLNTATPVARLPIEILRDSSEWASIRVRAITNAIPLKLYYDPTVPNGTLNIWPAPGLAYQLELFTWGQMSSFADLTTSYSLAPGYEAALKYALAEDLVMLPNKVGADRSGIPSKAMRYKVAVKSKNATPRRLISDAAMAGSNRGGGDYFNWLTGNF
jgi:hypothetical protein